jgi:hypothetical protein
MAIANPFRYGAIARGEHFADRERELEVLLTDIRGGQDVVIISPRRLGKTSLVEHALETLRDEGALVAYLDLLGAPTKEELIDDLAQALHDGLLSPLERGLDRIRSFFSHLIVAPRITIGEDARPQLEFLGYEAGGDADNLIEGLLDLPGRIDPGGRRIVVVLDEFQELVSIDERLPGQVRAAFQRQPEIAHVYLCSKRHLMEPLFMDRASPLYRSAKPMPLGPIPPEQFSGFLQDRFRAGGLEVDSELLERVFDLTGGRPYETQELCSFIWAHARAEGGEPTDAVFERALGGLIDAESARYLAVWDRLSASQRALLLALAREPGRVYAEDYRRRHRLGAASSVQAAAAALERLDLVESSASAGLVLADVFLRPWLQRLH